MADSVHKAAQRIKTANEVLEPTLQPAMMSREQMAAFIDLCLKLSPYKKINRSPQNKLQELHQVKPRNLANKVSAACCVATLGARGVGSSTELNLMWPIQKFTEADVACEAFNILGGVLTALLEELPHQRLELILKQQAERLNLNE